MDTNQVTPINAIYRKDLHPAMFQVMSPAIRSKWLDFYTSWIYQFETSNDTPEKEEIDLYVQAVTGLQCINSIREELGDE